MMEQISVSKIRWSGSFTFLATTLALAISCPPLKAQAKSASKWEAMSQTAISITGDAYLEDKSLWFQHHRLPLIFDEELSGKQLRAAAELLQATMNANTKAIIYKTHLPARVRLEGTNTLCGRRDTDWILIVNTIDREGRSNLNLAAF